MCHYKHLTLEERELLLKYTSMGYSLTETAAEMCRSKSTISRELKRNSIAKGYLPSAAQKKYRDRRRTCRPRKKLSDPELYAYVKARFLEDQWSPEEIDGRLKYENSQFSISYSTIYRAIYAHMFDDEKLSHGARGVIRRLRHKGKSRHTKGYTERRGKIQISHPLDERPDMANSRSRIGDWEADTMVGIKGKACLVTLVDRKSRYLVGGKAAGKRSRPVADVMIKTLKGLPLETITPDRGKEFSSHADVTKALDEVQFYFPKPYHSWERGTNENTNGLLREYFPKSRDISDISETYIQEMFNKLNRRPRKCLGYKTPFEVFHSVSLHMT